MCLQVWVGGYVCTCTMCEYMYTMCVCCVTTLPMRSRSSIRCWPHLAQFYNARLEHCLYVCSVFSPFLYVCSVFSPSLYVCSVFSPSLYVCSVFSPSLCICSVLSPSLYVCCVFSPSLCICSVLSPSL